jgi:hypothetical protein
LIRGELDRPEQPGGGVVVCPPGGPAGGPGNEPEPGPGPGIPLPKRYGRVRLRLADLQIARTSSLQPYLFKALQEQDAAATLSLTIDLRSETGVTDEVLERRIVEGLEQLGITVTWEPL